MTAHATWLRALLVGSLLLLGVGLAFGAGNLVLYNAGSPQMGDDLVKAFKGKYPDIKVDVIRAGSGELITRIKAEAARPQGDVAMGIAKKHGYPVSFGEFMKMGIPFTVAATLAGSMFVWWIWQ